MALEDKLAAARREIEALDADLAARTSAVRDQLLESARGLPPAAESECPRIVRALRGNESLRGCDGASRIDRTGCDGRHAQRERRLGERGRGRRSRHVVGVARGEAALRVSATAGAVATKRRAREPQAVHRVYREAGLAIRRKKRKHCVREGKPLVVRTSANQEWALDFVHDAVECGRTIRVLSVVDAYTRECLALEVDTSFASRRVTRVLGSNSSETRTAGGNLAATMSRSSPVGIFWRGAWSGRSS